MTDIVTPPLIDPLPPPPLPTDTPAQFDAKAFATLGAQVQLVTQVNATAAATGQNALASQERALAAGTAQGLAENARDAAQTARSGAESARDAASGHAATASSAAGQATTQAGLADAARQASQAAQGLSEGARDAAQAARVGAETARDQALVYKDQAQVFATQQLVGHSTTSLTPGAGAKTFTIEPSRSFVPGMYLVAASQGASANRMAGYVQSYNGTTGELVIAVDDYAGATARADWVIGVGAPGSSGVALATISTNTTAVPDVYYVATSPGITLTIPSGWAYGDFVGGRNASGGACYINWTTNTVAGQTPDAPMRWPSLGRFETTYNGSTFA